MKILKYILISLCLMGCGGPTSDNPYDVVGLETSVEVYQYDMPFCSNYGIYFYNSNLSIYNPPLTLDLNTPERIAKLKDNINLVSDIYNVVFGIDNFFTPVSNKSEEFWPEINTSGRITVQFTDRHPDAAGLSTGSGLTYNQCSCRILISPGFEDNWRVLSHEIGHCLGFGHSGDIRSLMYAGLTDNHFTQEFVDIIKQRLKDL